MSDDKALHRAMFARDTASGALAGGVGGAAAGVLASKAGVKVSPAMTAALGTLLGGGTGALRGKERTLRDRVREARIDQRYSRRLADADQRREARLSRGTTKKSQDQVMAACILELEKQADQAARGLAYRFGPRF
jgi:hypothetical protein